MKTKLNLSDEENRKDNGLYLREIINSLSKREVWLSFDASLDDLETDTLDDINLMDCLS
jgi:hypothetical protein